MPVPTTVLRTCVLMEILQLRRLFERLCFDPTTGRYARRTNLNPALDFPWAFFGLTVKYFLTVPGASAPSLPTRSGRQADILLRFPEQSGHLDLCEQTVSSSSRTLIPYNQSKPWYYALTKDGRPRRQLGS